MASLRTPIGMGMFVHLFVARPVVAGGEPRFNLTLLFDKEAQGTAEYRALKAACMEAIDAEFGAGKSKDANFLKTLRSAFRPAGEKSQYTGFTPDKVFINPWTKTKPGIVDGNLQDITAASDVWAGQLMRCTVAPFAYNQGGNKGVSLMLNNVQVVNANMPRMDGRKNANQDFDKTDAGDAGPAGDDDDDNSVPF
jgi:Protein of unknown function (DUF2815)